MKSAFIKIAIGSFFVLLTSGFNISAAPGDLDPTFGNGGKRVFGFGGTMDMSRASVVQNGKLVVAGLSESKLTLVRFGTNNLPDPEFGNQGTASLDMYFSIAGMRVQADGKIIVAGYAYENNDNDFALVRFNADGSLDEDFGSGGKVFRDFGGDDRCNGFIIDSNGRYVMVGTKNVSFPFYENYLVLTRFSSNGNLDFSFNGSGSYISTNTGSGNAVLQQADNKLLVAGYSGGNGVLCFNENGTPDLGFGNAGKLIIPSSSQVTALAVQAGNGTVLQPDVYLVAGRANVSGQNVIALARFDTAGVLDTGLNGTGVAYVNAGGSVNVAAMYVTGLTFSRRILIGGTISLNGVDRFMAARITLAGALDSSFGNGGVATTILSPGADNAYNAILQGGGLLLTGTTSPTNSYDQDFTLVRFTTGTGVLDTNFFGTGVLRHNVDDLRASPKGVAIQGDGRIVIAGSAYQGPYSVMSVTRLNSDGSFDATFGMNGTVRNNIGGQTSEADAVAIQPDGRIVIAGSAYDGKYTSVLVGRFLTNGLADSSFGTNGFTITRVGTNASYASVVRLQSDGKILVGGMATPQSDTDFLVLRYLPDGSPDPAWNGTGRVTIAIATSDDTLSGLAVLPDGKIIASGSGYFGTTYKVELARLNPNGILDPTFGSFGRLALSFPASGGDLALGLAQQSDSKLLLVGESLHLPQNDIDISVARVSTNGVLDSSFDGGGVVFQSIGLSTDMGLAVKEQPDNKILVGARTGVGSHFRFGVMRLLPDGSLDSSFGFGGKNYYELGTSGEEMFNAMALDSIGRLVMVGDANDVFGVLRVVGDTPFLLNFTSITRLGNGHILLRGTGVPNSPHTLLSSGTIEAENYSALAPVNADALGNWEYEDVSALPDENRFYRLSYP